MNCDRPFVYPMAKLFRCGITGVGDCGSGSQLVYVLKFDGEHGPFPENSGSSNSKTTISASRDVEFDVHTAKRSHLFTDSYPPPIVDLTPLIVSVYTAYCFIAHA